MYNNLKLILKLKSLVRKIRTGQNKARNLIITNYNRSKPPQHVNEHSMAAKCSQTLDKDQALPLPGLVCVITWFPWQCLMCFRGNNVYRVGKWLGAIELFVNPLGAGAGEGFNPLRTGWIAQLLPDQMVHIFRFIGKNMHVSIIIRNEKLIENFYPLQT